MLIVAPEGNENLKTSVKQMKASGVSSLRKSMTNQSVSFSIPTFIFGSDSIPLKNIFKALGLIDCFNSTKANFSLINGAEAAAATAVVMFKGEAALQ